MCCAIVGYSSYYYIHLFKVYILYRIYILSYTIEYIYYKEYGNIIFIYLNNHINLPKFLAFHSLFSKMSVIYSFKNFMEFSYIPKEPSVRCP